ncbi:hypothetical protein PVL29_007370 [Vitis rotundifolia]|uniref:Uncharacterized protein n=1 Tax=Vitis rotundifolia TaxID=103349 RepID=A0AA39DY65_VITRO|nr:hypothetical protein PVL29_007370 [Vitis rotundifolia]
MATNSSTSMKKGNTNLPPKRGQIKVQIFESFKETLVSTASKAGEALGIRSSKGGDSGGSSAPQVLRQVATTPTGIPVSLNRIPIWQSSNYHHCLLNSVN